MSDPTNIAILTFGGFAAFMILTAAMLRGWREWLDLKRAEMVAADQRSAPGSVSPAARIELADLKERVRRLEAIANGVEG